MPRIAIIGAGAAGIIAALQNEHPRDEVFLIDKNEKIGRKLAATGSGRGNLTNLNLTSDHYHGKPTKFIQQVLREHAPEQLRTAMASLGILTYATDDGWVYPISNSAANVRDILASHTEQHGVQILLNESVTHLQHNRHGFLMHFASDREPLMVDKVLISTGGAAAPQLGADVSILESLIKLGIAVHPIRPALSPITTETNTIKPLSGVRLDVTLSLYDHQARLGRNSGNLIFTDWGVNGPAAMNLSHLIRDDQHRDYQLEIDFLPDRARHVRDMFQQYQQTAFPVQSVLKTVLPFKIIQWAMDKLDFPARLKTNEITRSQTEKLMEILTHFHLPVTGTRGYQFAQLSTGGVDLNEISPRTMESRKVLGLYFAGEIMNVNAPCGGYNLHWAFATGMIAGKALFGENTE
ncbi:MAG: aminoacetone oxidase family FAD-binding enzyme [Anaerolineae bacterium]|jgi:predicted Rossmann fold flavoprotein|nr:aminoacetone oxidase family FAD-binding enzyme [Anaerolineae bacterium]